MPLSRLTWCHCATPTMSPWRGASSCHPQSLPTAPSTAGHCIELALLKLLGGGVWAGNALHSPQATFWLAHQINTQACTKLLSLVHADKEVIYHGPKQTSHGAGTLLHEGWVENGSLMKELLSCSQPGEVAREKHNGLKAGAEEFRRA